MKSKNYWYILISILAFLTLFILVQDLMPLVKMMIENKDNQAETINYVHQYGSKGIPILFLLVILQVFLPFIPTSLVGVLVGLCYGPLLGSVICISGLAVANTLIFYLVRRYHREIKWRKKRPAKQKRRTLNQDFIEKSKHPAIILIILYVIPIFPNSLLAFMFEKTKLTLFQYILCVGIASLPSVILYTFLGKHLSHGNYRMVIILGVFFGFILILAYFNRDKLVRFIETLIARE